MGGSSGCCFFCFLAGVTALALSFVNSIHDSHISIISNGGSYVRQILLQIGHCVLAFHQDTMSRLDIVS